ncbi:hypothetical protein [Bosea sp. BK604]|uniref:DUF6894 family protein n=1 Tax=Bosea sp. BK604 TaxID=2512180 RepID=UPI0010487A90|nr:hypothetical protein [Bosea sp. BK604]
MARFFIDSSDGETPFLDEEGLDLPDPEAARRAALAGLPDMAADRIPNGDRREFVVRVRDHDGRSLYCATMVLTGGWCTDGQDPAEHVFSPRPR